MRACPSPRLRALPPRRATANPGFARAPAGVSLTASRRGVRRQYYGVMGVGTPAQYFTVLCDTGSPVTWVPNDEWCATTTGCDGHHGFNASASSSVQPMNLSVAVAYGDGSSVRGTLVEERVLLGGVAVPAAAVALLQAGSSTPATGVFDGLLGLGLSNAVPPGVVQVAYGAGLLPQPMFSFWLNPDPMEPAAGGELLLGAANDEQSAGPRVWVNITSATLGGWPVVIEGVWVGPDGDGVEPVACGPSAPQCVAAVDTGTSLILGPPDAITALYAQINGAIAIARGGRRTWWRTWRPWGYTDTQGYLCGEAAKLMPAVSFGLGDSKLTITPWQYLRRDAAGSLTCEAGFGPVSLPKTVPGAPDWLLGDVFLSAYTTAFNFGNFSVGFAPALPPPRVTNRQAWTARRAAARVLLVGVALALAYTLLVEAIGLPGVPHKPRRSSVTVPGYGAAEAANRAV